MTVQSTRKPFITWQPLPVVITRLMVDRQQLIEKINDLETQWHEATDGDMNEVTLDLQALFDDIRELV